MSLVETFFLYNEVNFCNVPLSTLQFQHIFFNASYFGNKFAKIDYLSLQNLSSIGCKKVLFLVQFILFISEITFSLCEVTENSSDIFQTFSWETFVFSYQRRKANGNVNQKIIIMKVTYTLFLSFEWRYIDKKSLFPSPLPSLEVQCDVMLFYVPYSLPDCFMTRSIF